MNPHLTALGISSELIAARGLRECEEAATLEVAEVGADGRGHLLVPVAAEAWRGLKAAALAGGIDLFIVSAFRSIDRQAEIVRRKLESGAAVEAFSPSVRRRVLANTIPGEPPTSQPPAVARSKSRSTKPPPMLGSLSMPPNSATISLIPLATHGAINMSRGIGVSKTPNPSLQGTWRIKPRQP